MLKHFKSAGLILLYMGIYLIFQISVMLTILMTHLLGIGIMAAIKNQEINEAMYLELIPYYMLPTIIIAALISLLFYFLIFKLRKKSLIGWCDFSRLSLKNGLIIAVTGVALNIATVTLLGMLPIEKVFTDYTEMLETMINEANVFLVLATISIMVPIFEEILFRGMILNELKRNLPTTAAVIIQGILFGLYHLNLLQASYASALGIFLALVYLWFRSIWAPIILHIFFNTNSILWTKYVPGDFLTQNGILIFSLSVIMSIAGLYLLYRFRLKPQEAACDIVPQEDTSHNESK